MLTVSLLRGCVWVFFWCQFTYDQIYRAHKVVTANVEKNMKNVRVTSVGAIKIYGWCRMKAHFQVGVFSSFLLTQMILM